MSNYSSAQPASVVWECVSESLRWGGQPGDVGISYAVNADKPIRYAVWNTFGIKCTSTFNLAPEFFNLTFETSWQCPSWFHDQWNHYPSMSFFLFLHSLFVSLNWSSFLTVPFNAVRRFNLRILESGASCRKMCALVKLDSRIIGAANSRK